MAKLIKKINNINFYLKKLKNNAINKIVIIPNGASEEEFLSPASIDMRKKLDIPTDHFLILHVGSHTGGKGHKEAIAIFRKAHITNATLLIAANLLSTRCAGLCFVTKHIFNASPKRLVDKNQLIITSLSRQEIVSAYKQADVFLFPSNIECSPIVLFEAMASKTPFLTTDVGNAKEIIKWSNSGILLPTLVNKYGNSKAKIEESVDILEHIYNSPLKRQQMAQYGFLTWKKKFTWKKITREYEKMYLKLLNTNKI